MEGKTDVKTFDQEIEGTDLHVLERQLLNFLLDQVQTKIKNAGLILELEEKIRHLRDQQIQLIQENLSRLEDS